MATTKMKDLNQPRKVIVYRKELLRQTDTFVRAQVRSYRRWQVVLFGERIWPGGLSLEGIESRTLISGQTTLMKRVFAKARQTSGLTPASVLRKFAAEGASLVHAHFGHDGILALPYASALNLPLVVTLHGHDINIRKECYQSGEYGFQQRIYPYQFAGMARRRNVHFIAVSNVLQQTAIDCGVPSDRLTVCYTGIDLSQFQPGPKPVSARRRRILFVGRLVEMKGCAYLIKAFREISRCIPDTELVIIGDGPLRGDLEALARTLELRVQFLGLVSQEVVKQQLDEAQVFCLPSITASNGNYESFGMVLLEAQACGVPVITSALGGLEALAEGVTGFSFPEKDVGTLVRRACQILKNHELAARLAHAGPLHVRENFDILKCTRKIEDFYDSILSATVSSTETRDRNNRNQRRHPPTRGVHPIIDSTDYPGAELPEV